MESGGFIIHLMPVLICLFDQMEIDAHRVGGLLGVFGIMDEADTGRRRFSLLKRADFKLYIALYVSYVSGFLYHRQ